ncbi:MAG: SDR family oxidoreductase [Oceanospirillaceae bacterium]|jgi:NAD(P)-dependent dehydrogenase (short-subunit alcohol dehydrogenase family)|nr:SDR family oxidoreductase [Oceanospirillaceae bacterium]MBT4442254.1 SDR family oxidoreductase [Oceanospirillaceae bacterium]MBT6077326.1 SDR family oxidoreductase [Oceanospirillaceae bacterium]MBT7330766.1 SDR family oxidoreductase [Oceanospirillaceae bacterium]
MALPSSPSFNLQGKRALVAGASSGIGAACAVALSRAGAHVVLAARRQSQLDELVKEIRQEGFAAEALVMDVAQVASMQILVEQNGPFDVLVNSAGLARHSTALETQEEDFNAVMDINVKGAYFLTQAVAKGLIAAKKAGSLINISSQMAHIGGQDRAVYCASKHAVEGFTKAMAIEWGQHNIRVNTVCPTFILTDLTAATFADPQKRAWIESKIKLGRVGAVQDIMGAVVYLATEASAMVTGSAMKVDGGWTAG